MNAMLEPRMVAASNQGRELSAHRAPGAPARITASSHGCFISKLDGLPTAGIHHRAGFFVYIMTNRPKAAVLYIGITGDLVHRVWQHKQQRIPEFTSRCHLTRLVYYEQFLYPDEGDPSLRLKNGSVRDDAPPIRMRPL
jgi:hypothetical protein